MTGKRGEGEEGEVESRRKRERVMVEPTTTGIPKIKEFPGGGAEGGCVVLELSTGTLRIQGFPRRGGWGG